MTVQGRNEAAERLVLAGEELFSISVAALLQDAVDRHLTNEAMTEWTRAKVAFDEALAAERRATVERLREMFDAQMTNPNARWCSADEIAAILDEEAAR